MNELHVKSQLLSQFIQMLIKGRVNEPFESNKKVKIQVLSDEFIENIELTQQFLFCY